MLDPLARLNLPRLDRLLPPEPPPPLESAGVPDFPAAPSPADTTSADMPSPTAVADPPAVQPPPVDPLPAIEAELSRPLPPLLSDLERYRLENDRELLHRIAYRRQFLNREE